VEKPTEVKVVGFDMPFWNMVGFMIKVVFAAIPALLILALISFAVALLIPGLFVLFGY
jgi:hypothetical protein